MASIEEPNVRTPLLPGAVTNLSTSGSCHVVVPSSALVEAPNKRRSRWWSIRVMYVTMFMSAVTFTMTMPTIWPFLKVVDPGATPSFLGYVVASYSAGQLLASPFFGTWSAYRDAREPLLVSLVLQLGSNIFYAYVQSIPASQHGGNGGGSCLLGARLMMGFASGNAAVVRAYVSGATTLEERTGAMSIVSLHQSLGFILGPFIQTLLVTLRFPGPVEESWLHFNMYTAPALVSGLLTIVNAVLLVLLFRMHTISDSSNSSSASASAVINTSLNSEEDDEENKEEENKEENKEEDKEEEKDKEENKEENKEEEKDQEQEDEETGEKRREKKVSNKKKDLVAMAVILFLFFVTFFVFTIFETIGTPLTMDMYGWNKAEASRNMGLVLGGAGLVAIGIFFAVMNLSKRGVDERKLLLTGFCLCLVGFLFLLPWGHDLPALSPAPIYVPTTPSAPSALTNLLPGHNLTTVNTTALITATVTNATVTTATVTTATMASSSITTAVTNATLASSTVTTTAITTAFTNATAATITTAAVTSGTDVSRYLTGTAFALVNSSWTATATPTTEALHGDTRVSSVITTVVPRGCPWYFAWCGKVPKIQLWQFFVGTFFIAIGYATCNCMVYSIYSKVLGPGPQGMWMGVITAFGSLSRMLGPIFVAQIYDSAGPRTTFASTSGILVFTLLVFGLGWHRLLPFDQSSYSKTRSSRPQQKAKEESGEGSSSTSSSNGLVPPPPPPPSTSSSLNGSLQ